MRSSLAVVISISSLVLLACGPGGPDTGTGGGGGSAGWHKIEMPLGQEQNNVTGVFCSSTSKCVISTSSSTGDPGAVFAASDTAVGTKLFHGHYPDSAVSMASNTLGDIDFLGFVQTRNGLIARPETSSVFVSAVGDFTQPGAWSFVNMGRVDGDTFPLNATMGLQVDASNNWVFVNKQGFVYTASAAPSMSTTWTKVWSPDALPSVPADFMAQLMADPTLCDADVTAGGLPPPSNPLFIAQDLSVIVTVAGGLNQSGTAAPGVCISTDRGQHFYSRPFAGVPMSVSSPGPIGVTCTDNDHCYAFNGVPFQEGTGYIWYTSNATAGKTSTWMPATVPSAFATSQDITLSAVFFAPDKSHGWAVGANGTKPLLLRTTDSGHTWSDVSSSLSALDFNQLYNGFALDADHLFITGRFGAFAATGTAQN